MLKYQSSRFLKTKVSGAMPRSEKKRVQARPFSGFQPDHFAFFRDLDRHNNKEWFDRNRHRYDSVVAAFRELLTRLEEPALALNSHFDTEGKVNGNFSRINRDIRFQPGRAPYNTNYYLYLYDRRRGRKADGRFYVGLSDQGFSTGFSIYNQVKTGALRNILRPRLERDFERLHHWLERYIVPRRYNCYWYRSEKKQWIKTDGLPESAADWKRADGLVVRKFIRAAHPGLPTAALAHEIELTFERLYPLYAFTSIEGPSWKKHFPQASRTISRVSRGASA